MATAEIAGILGRAAGRPPPQVEAAGQWGCGQCGASFSTRRGLLAHGARVHRLRSEARKFVSGTACHACLMDFAARPLALVHVRNSRACLDTLRSFLPPLAEEEVEALDAADRRLAAGRRRDGRTILWASTPARRIHGPRPRPAGMSGTPVLVPRVMVGTRLETMLPAAVVSIRGGRRRSGRGRRLRWPGTSRALPATGAPGGATPAGGQDVLCCPLLLRAQAQRGPSAVGRADGERQKGPSAGP